MKHAKLPTTMFIPLNELVAIISNFSNIAGIGELDNAGLHVLLNETFEILISENPDVLTVFREETSAWFITKDVTFQQFTTFRKGLLLGIDKYLKQIEYLRCMWREHAAPYFNYTVSDDDMVLTLTVRVIYPSRDFTSGLLKEINEARENGEFIPYKYLRVLGMC